MKYQTVPRRSAPKLTFFPIFLAEGILLMKLYKIKQLIQKKYHITLSYFTPTFREMLEKLYPLYWFNAYFQVQNENSLKLCGS